MKEKLISLIDPLFYRLTQACSIECANFERTLGITPTKRSAGSQMNEDIEASIKLKELNDFEVIDQGGTPKRRSG